MSQLTIRPVLKMIESSSGRDNFKIGDLRQLAEKVSNALNKKLANPKQEHSAFIERKYLEIINQLIEHFADTKNIDREILLSKVNDIMINENFYYETHKHRSPHTNHFNIKGSYARKGLKSYYDIALYNNMVTDHNKNRRHSHHSYKDEDDNSETKKISICYARCEPHGENILFGNLQIDQKNPKYWNDPDKAKILLSRKNIYQSLVAESIKHAVNNNYKRILFQCGDAVKHSQAFGADYVIVTPSNFKKHKNRYLKALKYFDDLRVGDVCDFENDSGFRTRIVINKNDKKIKSYVLDTSNVNRKDCWDTYFIWAVVNRLYKSAKKQPTHHDRDAVKSFAYHNTQELLKSIDEIFKVAGVKSDGNVNEKLTDLKNICEKNVEKHKGDEDEYDYFVYDRNRRKFYSCIAGFLTKYGYEEKFLAKHKHFKKIKRTDKYKRLGSHVFINIKRHYRIKEFKREYITEPVMGKSYYMEYGNKYNFLHNHKDLTNDENTGKILYWYDQALPDSLSGLKLKFERVPIYSKNRKKAHAWLITDGIEEFMERPRAAFAHREDFKMDCVSLGALEKAAAKFGLNNKQLSIANDWLLDSDNLRCVGAYHKDSDNVSLANTSLSILAHEGFHRLVAKGMVPPKEYRAMVYAGKRIVEQDKFLTKEINRKDAEGYNIYPLGKERDEEYAAIFTETYFENNQLARKNLMGQKIKVTDKIFGYLQATYDVVKGYLGDDAAIARSFLRRVEKNKIMDDQERSLVEARDYSFAK